MQSKRIIAACYCSLSDDDEQDGTSISIETQKKILGDYCRDFGITDYIDGIVSKSSICSICQQSDNHKIIVEL